MQTHNFYLSNIDSQIKLPVCPLFSLEFRNTHPETFLTCEFSEWRCQLAIFAYLFCHVFWQPSLSIGQ